MYAVYCGSLPDDLTYCLLVQLQQSRQQSLGTLLSTQASANTTESCNGGHQAACFACKTRMASIELILTHVGEVVALLFMIHRTAKR
jgi:hypothetical protein